MDKLTILKVKKTQAWIEFNKELKEKILELKDITLSSRITRSEYDREMVKINHTIDFLRENMENWPQRKRWLNTIMANHS